MTDKPYEERRGGSYIVDAKTGRAQRVEATAEQSGTTTQLAATGEAAGSAPSAPAPSTPKKSEGKGD